MEVSRSLILATNVPKYFWGEAVLTAAYLINRMPSRVLNFETPCQKLLTIFPHIQIVSKNIPTKIFGCTASVQIHQQFRSKLDPKSIKCIFLGYSPTQKGYKCYSPVTKKFYHSIDVTFFEDQPYYPKAHIQGEKLIESWLWETEPVPNHEPVPPIPDHEPEPIPGHEPVQPVLHEPETEPSPETVREGKDLIVYSRRPKIQKAVENQAFPK